MNHLLWVRENPQPGGSSHATEFGQRFDQQNDDWLRSSYTRDNRRSKVDSTIWKLKRSDCPFWRLLNYILSPIIDLAIDIVENARLAVSDGERHWFAIAPGLGEPHRRRHNQRVDLPSLFFSGQWGDLSRKEYSPRKEWKRTLRADTERPLNA